MKYRNAAIIALALLASFTTGYYLADNKPQPYTEADAAAIKAYILQEIDLTPKQLKRLDMNKDGHISSLDYVMVKNRTKKDAPRSTN